MRITLIINENNENNVNKISNVNYDNNLYDSNNHNVSYIIGKQLQKCTRLLRPTLLIKLYVFLTSYTYVDHNCVPVYFCLNIKMRLVRRYRRTTRLPYFCHCKRRTSHRASQEFCQTLM